jgi:succinyl-CoA synthetase beta subunit
MLSRVVNRNAFRMSRIGGLVPLRRLNIHEYLSQGLLEEFGVPNARGSVASTAEEAEHVAHALGGSDFVVKAQVLAGGRGKGTFTNGFQGGVHTATSPEEVKDLANKMLGERLVTKQTGGEGKEVSKVYVVERMYLRRETYFAILMDRASQGPVLVGSSQGGMDIEQVARDSPSKILKEPIDIMKGIQEGQLERLAAGMGFSKKAQPEAIETMRKLYKMFLDLDCTLVEINPMGETPEGKSKFFLGLWYWEMLMLEFLFS